jgi:hypothetical protein
MAPGDRRRNRARQSAVGCPCRLKKVDNGSGTIQLIRNSREGHNHEYSAPAWKIPSGIQALADEEVWKGYTPCQVANNLRNPQNGNRQALYLAGGEALRLQDVRNAGSQWLQANPRQTDVEADEICARSWRKLEFQEVLDSLLTKYYELELVTKEWDSSVRDMAIREWIKILGRITGALAAGSGRESKRSCVIRGGGNIVRPMRGQD